MQHKASRKLEDLRIRKEDINGLLDTIHRRNKFNIKFGIEGCAESINKY